MCVCVVFIYFFFIILIFGQKNGAPNVIATARVKFASEARLSQYIVPFGNTEPTCIPLSGHFMDIESRVLVHQREGEIPTQSNLKCLMVTKGGSYY